MNTPLIFSKRKALADALGMLPDANFTRIVRAVEEAHGITLPGFSSSEALRQHGEQEEPDTAPPADDFGVHPRGTARELEVLKMERNAARQQVERLVRTLASIHMRLNPKLIESGGKTFHFVNPHANECLDQLSQLVREIPDQLALSDTITSGETRALIDLAVQQEREVCAALCDEQAAMWTGAKWPYAQAVGKHCAKAIRARGVQEGGV